jgi:purine-nucleoside phosphorylase
VFTSLCWDLSPHSDTKTSEVLLTDYTMSHPYEIAAKYLMGAVPHRPVLGVICGSGLSGLSNCVENPVTVHYHDIPGFPEATVPGHKGELVFGTINGIEVMVMRGRFHFYEGNSMTNVVMPVRCMRLMGVKMLIVTNAAGGLNPAFNVGDIGIVQDHFGLPIVTGQNPLIGLNDDGLGPRFPALSDTYDSTLQSHVIQCAKALGYEKYVHSDCTYCFVTGPAYESRAECRFLRSIGGDMVGMSTVPEIVAAKHVGMKVLGLSLITNKVVIEKTKDTVHASHEEVLAAVQSAGSRVESIVKKLISKEVLGEFLDNCPTVKYSPSAESSNKKSLIAAWCTEERIFKAALLGSICYLSYVLGRKAASK